LFRTVCGAGLLEAPSKIGGRRWTEARHVIDTHEQAAISKSGEACYYFHCIFKFASSLGQSDMFSLAGYSDMKSKLVASLR
jgi:ubiquinone/menaquinone biosynthesis C-methylase UbiE